MGDDPVEILIVLINRLAQLLRLMSFEQFSQAIVITTEIVDENVVFLALMAYISEYIRFAS